MSILANNNNDTPASDVFDRLVYENGIRIKDLHIYPDLDLMVVLFNNKRILSFNLSDFDRLKDASPEQLKNWEFENDGIAVTWEELDEDLSAVGFIRQGAIRDISKKDSE